MTYLDRAIKDGYAIITGPENKQKIIYVTSDNHTEMRMGDNMAIDMDSGELHIISGWPDDEDDD